MLEILSVVHGQALSSNSQPNNLKNLKKTGCGFNPYPVFSFNIQFVR